MTGGIEAIGSVVEGGMLARAVEPTAGEAANSGPIAGAGGETHEDACLMFVPLVRIYKQLKGAYSLSRFSALWRTAAICFFIFWILFLFVDLLLVLGAVD